MGYFERVIFMNYCILYIGSKDEQLIHDNIYILIVKWSRTVMIYKLYYYIIIRYTS
jgi:hypothetical protein